MMPSNIGYHAAEISILSRGPSKRGLYTRGVPMSKALRDETLLAFKMNGEDIPLVHGLPIAFGLCVDGPHLLL